MRDHQRQLVQNYLHPSSVHPGLHRVHLSIGPDGHHHVPNAQLLGVLHAIASTVGSRC